MSDGGLTVLDGTTLRHIELHLPDSKGAITGAQLLAVAEAEVSSSLYGLSLPETLKSNALKRINIDSVKELDREEATSKLKEYVIAIADELKDNPLVVSVLDGTPLRLFLEDEDDFAMLAENLFTDLDVVDKGKVKKKEIRSALVQMGVELGVPPISEHPFLDEILKKHGSEGEEELGQAQFAESLQPVIQDLADALAKQHVTVIESIKISNGSKLRKLLADKEQLDHVIDAIFNTDGGNGERGCTGAVRGFLEKNGPMLGLPSQEGIDAVVLLYDEVFTEVNNENTAGDMDRDKIGVLVKSILEKIAQRLEANPIFHGLDN